jgi:AcrR family transcriptional regulator
MPNPKKTPENSASAKDRILNAAISSIEKYGLERTTMEEIAAEAGVVRKTVYLIFGNRKALFDAVLLRKIGSNIAKVKQHVDSFDTLAEALVNGCTHHISLIRKDNVFFQTLRSAHDIELDRYLLGADSPVIDMTIDIWRDALDKARERGELRANLTDAEIASWLLCVTSFLLVRNDLSERGQNDMLEKFLLPALLIPR